MKTVIWDFNGTILDDAMLCLEIENNMLEVRGLEGPHTIEQRRSSFCFPVKHYYDRLGYTFEHETFEVVADEFNNMYQKRFMECSLVDGFIELIKESINHGFDNVILSASKQITLNKQCKELKIDHMFKDILGIENGLAGSKIDMAKKWMEESDIDPKQCLYIGDTTHDKETAEAIGITNYYLVACGHQSYDVLKQSGAKQVVKGLKEVRL